MTRFLARLADIAYRRRGRMVIAWIVAAILIIGVGSSLAGEYSADYDTPGSDSKAAGDLTEQRFDVLRPGDLRRLEGRGRRRQPRRDGARQRISGGGRTGQSRLRAHPDPVLGGRHDRVYHPPAHGARLGCRQGGRREADRRRRGEQRRRVGDQARRGSDLHRPGAVQPGGDRLPRGRDRPPDRLRLGGRRRPAARDRPRRPRDHIGWTDRPPRQRDRRPRLDHGGLRA